MSSRNCHVWTDCSLFFLRIHWTLQCLRTSWRWEFDHWQLWWYTNKVWCWFTLWTQFPLTFRYLVVEHQLITSFHHLLQICYVNILISTHKEKYTSGFTFFLPLVLCLLVFITRKTVKKMQKMIVYPTTRLGWPPVSLRL